MFPPARKMRVTTPISTQEKMKLKPTPLRRETDNNEHSHIIITLLERCSKINQYWLKVQSI